MFWVPQSGNIAMGVSILSYAGGVQFGLVTDAALTPAPERVVERFRPEFERLLMTVLMEPWDLRRDPKLVEREFKAGGKAHRVARRGRDIVAARPRPHPGHSGPSESRGK
jgi:hypothetical protein